MALHSKSFDFKYILVFYLPQSTVLQEVPTPLCYYDRSNCEVTLHLLTVYASYVCSEVPQGTLITALISALTQKQCSMCSKMNIATFTAAVPSFCELLEQYCAIERDVLDISKYIGAFKTSGTTHPMVDHHTREDLNLQQNRCQTLKF